MSDDAASPRLARPLLAQLGLITLVRLCVNTSRRFAYPFAAVLGRGLGVPLPAITSLIAANQITGLLGPLFGPLSDRWGYRTMMLVGLGLLAGGMLAGGLWPWYGVIALALFLAGLAKVIFDPALQAYIGERVPYARRGLAIGLTEFSWAGSTLIVVPLIGLLMERWGWRAPFFLLGGVGLSGLLVMRWLLPSEPRRTAAERRGAGFREAWQTLRDSRAALGAVLFAFLVAMANDLLFVVYGPWLEQSFALSTVALGASTTVIGVAELVGEGTTAALADRLGLKRAVVGGGLLVAFSYLGLPLVGHTLLLALGGLFLIFLAFEFMMVSMISLLTELVPGARATMLAAALAAAGLGRVCGSLLGGPLWLAGGLWATGLLAAALSGLGVGCLAGGLIKSGR
jgi:predicted MFS family arabinose efflux permease